MAREALEVLKECEAFLEGHFLLSSGRHSGAYCQMAFLQQYPDKAAEVMAPVAEKLKELNVDVVVGPAMGGIVYAYELGRQLGKRAIFTERVDNVMTLKRFRIHPGERCVIAEDVVTTGVSSLETGRFISFFVEGNGEKNPPIHQVQGKSFGIYQLCIRIMGSVGIVFPPPALFSPFILNARNARKRVQVI